MLKDNDIILILQALKRNTHLRHLDLEGNNLTSIGVKALLSFVFDYSSLNAISESNHTLEKLVLFPDNCKKNGSWLQDCIDRMLELGQTDKIVLALQDKVSLLKYFANVPVKLIPEVLAFICLGHCPHKHFNIVYSIMRWWNIPTLYSYHNSCSKRKRDD